MNKLLATGRGAALPLAILLLVVVMVVLLSFGYPHGVSAQG